MKQRVEEGIYRVPGIDHVLDQPRPCHDRPANDVAKHWCDRPTTPAVDQRQHSEGDDRGEERRILAGHGGSGQHAGQAPDRPTRRGAITRSRGRRPYECTMIEAERAFHVREDRDAIDPRRRKVDYGRDPARPGRSAARCRTGDEHGRRRGEKCHQDLPRQPAPPPVAHDLHGREVKHLNTEWHACINIMRHEGDVTGLVIFFGPFQMIFEHVEVDGREHRPQDHHDHERGDHDPPQKRRGVELVSARAPEARSRQACDRDHCKRHAKEPGMEPTQPSQQQDRDSENARAQTVSDGNPFG